MKRPMLTILFLAAGMASAYSQDTSVKPKSGFVPDAETAVKVGEAVLMPVYGDRMIRDEEPFKAKREGDVWTVEGTLNCGAPQCVGGTAVVKISKTSGEILFMAHNK